MPILSIKRGAIPSPRSALAAATPLRALVGAPPNFNNVPARIAMWGNDAHGDCVTAEEALAKACDKPEIFIPESDVINWAMGHGVLEGVGELAACIKAQGLLQNLVVPPDETKLGNSTGDYGVAAGAVQARARITELQSGEWVNLTVSEELK